MALITTPGDATANSYASLAEYDAYLAAHLYGSAAALLSNATKENALIMTTRLLDAYPRAWTGDAVDAVQALGWPRTGMFNRNGFDIPTTGAASIPQALKDAQSEFARQLSLADRTKDNAIINQGIVGIKAGSVEIKFRDEADESTLAARSVRELNALMSVIPDAVKMLLVPSWLLPDPEDAAILAASNSLLLFESL